MGKIAALHDIHSEAIRNETSDIPASGSYDVTDAEVIAVANTRRQRNCADFVPIQIGTRPLAPAKPGNAVTRRQRRVVPSQWSKQRVCQQDLFSNRLLAEIRRRISLGINRGHVNRKCIAGCHELQPGSIRGSWIGKSIAGALYVGEFKVRRDYHEGIRGAADTRG